MVQKSNDRPVFLDLARIHLPVPAIVSILHRLTGLILLLAIPFMLYQLESSLAGPEGYAQAKALSFPVRLLVVFLLWGLLHHLFSGVRFLLIDLDIGVGRVLMRRSAWVVLAAGVVATLVFFLVLGL